MAILNKYKKNVSQIEKLRDKMGSLSDEELRNKTEEFKEALKNGKTEDDILIEAFAVVREAAKRVLGMEHYPVQLMGGMALHDGNIAEMKTGEGKTQTCLLPAYLNALSGNGVHVVTVNDYLAARDAELMGSVHNFLGLSVGVVLSGMNNEQRKEAYNCDITYVTNSELGFDYLRDNMATSLEQKVQRPLNFVIIDEVDSVLIDEARTPLIIAGKGTTPSDLYVSCDNAAKRLKKGIKRDKDKWDDIDETGDYVVDEKEKTVTLTDRGIKKVEKMFGIQNYADTENAAIQHGMIMALRANAVMKRDTDYIVRDGKVDIVDEFTGRVLDGRRFSDGLHQAIEAKEGVEIQAENITQATITYQHFFNKYKKRSGMTGTAMTEKTEFKEIYHMGVVEIPTNRPVIRVDEEDRVYKTKGEKYHEILEEIVRVHSTGQPVLVGTTTVEISELISTMLKKRGIAHNVLNAKYHEIEAKIVADAGKHGAVTIATNMAGRGTDIKLDEEAKAAGGLCVIGTDRHEARRIDNQLRGRSGRQGDPGRSVFFLSLEDDIISRYGNQKVIDLIKNAPIEQNQALQSKALTKAILKAQIRIEGQHYNIRKSLLEYDKVNDEQRTLIYEERDRILRGENLMETYERMAKKQAEYVAEYADDDQEFFRWMKMAFHIDADPEDYPTPESRKQYVLSVGEEGFQNMLQKFPDMDVFNTFASTVFLKIIDKYWVQHIDALSHLKEGISLQSYGQRDPKVAYRSEAYEMFDDMLDMIRASVISILYSAKITQRIVPASAVNG